MRSTCGLVQRFEHIRPTAGQGLLQSKQLTLGFLGFHGTLRPLLRTTNTDNPETRPVQSGAIGGRVYLARTWERSVREQRVNGNRIGWSTFG